MSKDRLEPRRVFGYELRRNQSQCSRYLFRKFDVFMRWFPWCFIVTRGGGDSNSKPLRCESTRVTTTPRYKDESNSQPLYFQSACQTTTTRHRFCNSSMRHYKTAIGEVGNRKPPHKIRFPRTRTQSHISGFFHALNRVCNAVVSSVQ